VAAESAAEAVSRSRAGGRLESAGAATSLALAAYIEIGGGWLRQLAINTWLNHLRSAPKLASLDDADATDEPAVTHTTGEALDLDRALGLLSRDERLCIVLAYHEGMSHGEITTATSLPLGTVKSHIKRGSERLRVLLHAYQPADDQPAESNRHVR
jgi:ATP/maltotriose-dependent transcriptional regulator MalT